MAALCAGWSTAGGGGERANCGRRDISQGDVRWASNGHTKKLAVHDGCSKIHSLATSGTFADVAARWQEAGNEKTFLALRPCLSFCLPLFTRPLCFRSVNLLGSSRQQFASDHGTAAVFSF